MKAYPVALAILGTLVLGGCQTTQNLQSADAQLARQLMSEHCVVGQMHVGISSRSIPTREGVVSKRTDGILLNYKHKLYVEDIYVYSVREGQYGWLIVDASSQRARDNFYFKRDTGEFACSQHEWHAAGGNLKKTKFESAPQIAPSMDKIE